MFVPEEYLAYADTDLLHLAQQGNYDALLSLLTKYIPLVKARSSVFVQDPTEFEDFFQEGMVALFGAIRSFKQESGTFSSFAKICVDNALISHLRAIQKKSSIPADKLLPLNDFLQPVSADADPQDIFIAKEAVQTRKKTLVTQLSDREYEILSHYLNGESYQTIAHTLNISEKSVDNAIQRIRRKLKNK